MSSSPNTPAFRSLQTGRPSINCWAPLRGHNRGAGCTDLAPPLLVKIAPGSHRVRVAEILEVATLRLVAGIIATTPRSPAPGWPRPDGARGEFRGLSPASLEERWPWSIVVKEAGDRCL